MMIEDYNSIPDYMPADDLKKLFSSFLSEVLETILFVFGK